MRLVLLLYIAVVVCNPTTTLNEAGIIYLAYVGMQKAGINMIKVGDMKVKIIAFPKSVQEFLEKTSAVMTGPYEMKFVEDDILKWQDQFNEKEKIAVEQYKKGHPTYIAKINGKENLIIEGKGPQFQHGLTSDLFNVQYQNIFEIKPENPSFSKVLDVCGNIIHAYNKERMETFKSLSKKVFEARIEKVVSYGKISNYLVEELKEEDPRFIRRRIKLKSKGDIFIRVRKGFNIEASRVIPEKVTKEESKKLETNIKLVNDIDTLNKVKELAKDEKNFNKVGRKEAHLKIIFETGKVIQDKKSYMPISIINEKDEKIKSVCRI